MARPLVDFEGKAQSVQQRLLLRQLTDLQLLGTLSQRMGQLVLGKALQTGRHYDVVSTIGLHCPVRPPVVDRLQIQAQRALLGMTFPLLITGRLMHQKAGLKGDTGFYMNRYQLGRATKLMPVFPAW